MAQPETPDQRLAWALLAQILADLKDRKHSRSHKRAVREIESWMANDARRAKYCPSSEGYLYTFEYWCEQLGCEADYMARKLKENLL